MYLDFKITSWERFYPSTKKRGKEIEQHIKSNNDIDMKTLYEIDPDGEFISLDDLSEHMSTYDNNGQATIEAYKENNGTPFFTNEDI